uniref:uncharacterized protein LOC124052790 n=1 Tax=Scatophagus argus TaxID=75038 RepID=UPI001ED8232F|nr:uncharacterized protein LOC124052790 [Scatophagus argus]
MASSVLRREKYLLYIGVDRVVDDRYDALPLPRQVLELEVTNLRNRPLSNASVNSLRESVLGLYHNLVTGSKDFPPIPFSGSFASSLRCTPFVRVAQAQKENTSPCPLMAAPSGLVPPLTQSISSDQIVLTPVLPEKADMEALKADRRNCVRPTQVDGKTVTRVISPVYHVDTIETPNCWRVSDYREDGQVLMSVFCQFTRDFAQYTKPRQQTRKRKNTDTESSSSRLSKRMRV